MHFIHLFSRGPSTGSVTHPLYRNVLVVFPLQILISSNLNETEGGKLINY